MKGRKFSFYLLLLLLLFLWIGVIPSLTAAENNVGNSVNNVTMEIDRFVSSEKCGGCHIEIFEQWQNSMHNLSHKDPIYAKIAPFLQKGLTDPDEQAEAESCVKCHTAVGHITGFPQKVSDDLSKTPERASEGIQCDYCHSAVNITKMYNNGLVIEPGYGEGDPGIKYGPFDDAEPDFHEAEFSKLHTDPNICGTCHDVKHIVFGTDLETTYTEWKNSPYNSTDSEKHITCQGCHMYQRPGIPATASTERPENPGSAADYSQQRPHIFTHYFVGGNVGIPALFNGIDKANMARERLKNAAELSLDLSRLNNKKLGIIVKNSGAGHSIPTGVTHLRQVWLEILVLNRDKQLMFSSGQLDEKNELSEDTVIFRNLFGDGQGNPVINLAMAREILADNRIKAGESITYTCDLPGIPGKGSVIQVRLLYRSMPAKILKLLPFKPVNSLPIVEMAKIKQRL